MSAASDLLQDLAEHGVTVWQDAGQLHYRAPAGAMTPATLAAIRRHKPELLTLLTANDCLGANHFPNASPARAREGPPAVFVLAFDLDGKSVTCRDPVSASMA